VSRLTRILLACGLVLAGALIGLAVGIATPAHTEIAGADAAVRLRPGHPVDELDLSGVLRGIRATDRSVLGEPVGVSVHLALDEGTFTTSDGTFNADVLPAYIQAYSDPAQLARDMKWAVVKHLLVYVVGGAVVALLAIGAGLGYRAWRRRFDRAHPGTAQARAAAVAYRAPDRRLGRVLAVALVVVLVIGMVPGSRRVPDPAPRIVPNPLFDGTPLAGTQVTGVLSPLIGAAQSYIRTYFAATDTYYDQLRGRLEQLLETSEPQLPAAADGQDLVHIGFVTDRHCNIGMDRVVVALLQHYRITTLVSGGDDDFSGSFPFESACTKNLAAKSQQAGMTDVFVAGNHDSAQTLADERDQKIKVLDGQLVTSDGLHFAGYPDPRSSRYGTGLLPSSAAERAKLLREQGQRTGKLACTAKGPVIVVLHDPAAGRDALESGCGKAVLALDGHKHRQAGPTPIALPSGEIGYQFVGASSGGAPTEDSVERSFASQLTVGPLNHPATVNIVTVDRGTGALVGVTVFGFTPDQQITVSSLTPGG
jgi:hypothetical protein